MRWGSFPSSSLLFFPCLECSGGGVQRLSWGVWCRLWAICPGLGSVGGFVVGQGGVCSCRSCRQRAGQSSALGALLPLAALAVPPTWHTASGPRIPGPRLLSPALSQLLPLSPSLSLAFRRKVDVRCVHTSWAGWWGRFAGGGGVAVCMWPCPCLWSLAPLAAHLLPQLMSPPPTSLTMS